MEHAQPKRRISGFSLLGKIIPFIFNAGPKLPGMGMLSTQTHGIPFQGNHSSGRFKKNLRKIKKRQRRRAYLRSL